MTENTRAIWYLKWNLTDDLSIRYFYKFQDKPEFENKWVLKSHKDKKYEIINREVVEMLFKAFNLTDNNAVEIIGRNLTQTKFRKLEVVNPQSYNVKGIFVLNNNDYIIQVYKPDLKENDENINCWYKINFLSNFS